MTRQDKLNREANYAPIKDECWSVGVRREIGDDSFILSPDGIYNEDNEDRVAMVYGIPHNCTLEDLLPEERYQRSLNRAYIIAAAPDMFRTLLLVEKVLDSISDPSQESTVQMTQEQVRDAINRAIGLAARTDKQQGD